MQPNEVDESGNRIDDGTSSSQTIDIRICRYVFNSLTD